MNITKMAKMAKKDPFILRTVNCIYAIYTGYSECYSARICGEITGRVVRIPIEYSGNDDHDLLLMAKGDCRDYDGFAVIRKGYRVS